MTITVKRGVCIKTIKRVANGTLTDRKSRKVGDEMNREKAWPPDDVWVPYDLPWIEGRCIPIRRMNLINGKWVFESCYPKPLESNRKTACDGCENKGSEDCALGKPGSENAYCPNGKLR